MRLKFRLSWIIYIILAGFLLPYISWWTGALYLGHIENQWIDGKRNDGWKIEFSERTKTGFPLRWRSNYREITIKTPSDKKKSLHWSSNYVFFDWSPLNPRHLSVVAGGKTSTKAFNKSLEKLFELSFDGLNIDISTAGHDRKRYTFFAKRIETLGGILNSVIFHNPKLKLTLSPEKYENSIPKLARLNVSAEKIELPNQSKNSANFAIKRLLLRGDMYGDYRTELRPREALSEWRQSGGRVEINELRADWGGINFQSVGTYSVDQELRLLASLKIEASGFRKLFQSLDKTGVLGDSDLFLLQMVLSGLSAKNRENNNDKVSIPITAQDGWLAVGPIRLLKLRPILN
ncbi:MAG: DUF2125 domain-containing protein [Pseudomonadota bacterium]|nr:DUF2125 domain-containing protein [Pseudomonadota bacterium]